MSFPRYRPFASVGYLYRQTGFEQGLNRVSAPPFSMDRRNSCPLFIRRERETGRDDKGSGSRCGLALWLAVIKWVVGSVSVVVCCDAVLNVVEMYCESVM